MKEKIKNVLDVYNYKNLDIEEMFMIYGVTFVGLIIIFFAVDLIFGSYSDNMRNASFIDKHIYTQTNETRIDRNVSVFSSSKTFKLYASDLESGEVIEIDAEKQLYFSDISKGDILKYVSYKGLITDIIYWSKVVQ